MRKNHDVKVKNIPGSASETVLDEIDTLVGQKRDCILVHAGANNIIKSINIINAIKKTKKKVKDSLPNRRLVFLSLYSGKTREIFQKMYLMLIIV